MRNQRSLNYKKTDQARRAGRFNVDLIAPMIFCTVEAIILLALSAILYSVFLNENNQRMVPSLLVALFICYVVSAGMICLFYFIKSRRVKRARLASKQFETEIYDIFRYIIDLPYAVIDREGTVKVMNGALIDILGYKNAVSGIELSKFCSVQISVISASAKNREAYLDDPIYSLPGDSAVPDMPITRLADGRRYRVIPYVFKNKEQKPLCACKNKAVTHLTPPEG